MHDAYHTLVVRVNGNAITPQVYHINWYCPCCTYSTLFPHLSSLRVRGVLHLQHSVPHLSSLGVRGVLHEQNAALDVDTPLTKEA